MNTDPDDYLGHLLVCLKECAGRECSISVQCGKDQQLVIFPHNGQALCRLDNDQLGQLSAARSNKRFTLEINHDTASSEAATYKADGLPFLNLEIENVEVYSFYRAAVATGLAGPEKCQVDGLMG
ncbi:MAG: hypothetical protein L3J84_06100 [Gammaproteobacteria bacterium]|nr:hypothetical protein [Gammaproteobacteria bacterium]